MQTKIAYDRALLGLVGAGDRVALALVTRRVMARLRAVGAYDLKGRWDDACMEIVTDLLEAARARAGTDGDGGEGLPTCIDRAVWRRMAAFLRRSPLAAGARTTLDPADARGVRASASPLDADGPERLAVRQAFARIARERQELLWRRYLDRERIDQLAEGADRSAQDMEREITAARAEFRNLRDLVDAAEVALPGVDRNASYRFDGDAQGTVLERDEGGSP